MRDVYEVLRAKESLIEQLHQEIEALRLVAPLLYDNRDNGSFVDAPGNQMEADAQDLRSREGSGAASLPLESDGERAEVTEEAVGTAQRISGRLRRLARPVLDAVSSMAG